MADPEKDAPLSKGGRKQPRASGSPIQTTRSRPSASSSAARGRRTPAPPVPKNWFERIQYTLQDPVAFRQFRASLPTWVDEFGAFAFVLVGVLTFTALINPSGALTGPLANALTTAFGNGAYLIALTLVAIGAMLLLPRAGLGVRFSWTRILALEVAFLATQGLLHLAIAYEEPRAFAREGKGGGHVGWAISSLMLDYIGQQTAITILVGVCVVSLAVAVGVSRREVRLSILLVSEGLQYLANRMRPEPAAPADDLPLPPPSRGLVPPTRIMQPPDEQQNRGPVQSGRYGRPQRPSDKSMNDQTVVQTTDHIPTVDGTTRSSLSAPPLSDDESSN